MHSNHLSEITYFFSHVFLTIYSSCCAVVGVVGVFVPFETTVYSKFIKYELFITRHSFSYIAISSSFVGFIMIVD